MASKWFDQTLDDDDDDDDDGGDHNHQYSMSDANEQPT